MIDVKTQTTTKGEKPCGYPDTKTTTEQANRRVMIEWQNAYRKANGKSPPQIFYGKGGWFWIEPHKKFRRSQLVEMIENLRRRHDK